MIAIRKVVRKSAPQVLDGRVQKKNNWALSTDYYRAPIPTEVVIDRKRPGNGYRHVLTKQDIHRFLGILPDWDNLAVGLNAVVLAPGEWDAFGYHVPGAVHVCAWDSTLWFETTRDFYEDHQELFDRLQVETEEIGNGILCRFDEGSVRAFQLLHILLHELGHHHDRMTTRSQRRSARGESYAEEYARQYEKRIWDRYWQVFQR